MVFRTSAQQLEDFEFAACVSLFVLVLVQLLWTQPAFGDSSRAVPVELFVSFILFSAGNDGGISFILEDW